MSSGCVHWVRCAQQPPHVEAALRGPHGQLGPVLCYDDNWTRVEQCGSNQLQSIPCSSLDCALRSLQQRLVRLCTILLVFAACVFYEKRPRRWQATQEAWPRRFRCVGAHGALPGVPNAHLVLFATGAGVVVVWFEKPKRCSLCEARGTWLVRGVAWRNRTSRSGRTTVSRSHTGPLRVGGGGAPVALLWCKSGGGG